MPLKNKATSGQAEGTINQTATPAKMLLKATLCQTWNGLCLLLNALNDTTAIASEIGMDR